MALERQSIEKKDFPIGRRGYDPEAVDAHLSAVAEEVEELKRSARRRTETLASSASEQVRAIVEAAETSATDIQRQAEEDAQEIRDEADSAAQASREQAVAQARDYVGRVSESTAVMGQRLDAMDSELGALIESLRTGSNRLTADLQLLDGNLTEVKEAVIPRPRFEREGGSPEEQLLAGDIERGGEAEDQPVPPEAAAPDESDQSWEDRLEVVSQRDEPLEESTAQAVAAGSAGTGGSDDTEGARLIALNMALNGTPRQETDRYLADNFQLSDRSGLLEEVYASVEG